MNKQIQQTKKSTKKNKIDETKNLNKKKIILNLTRERLKLIEAVNAEDSHFFKKTKFVYSFTGFEIFCLFFYIIRDCNPGKLLPVIGYFTGNPVNENQRESF